MKTIKIVSACMLSLVMVTGLFAQADTKTEQLVVPLSDPGKPYSLHVDLINGSIKVVGYEGKDVVIDVQQGSERIKKNKDGSLGSLGSMDVHVNVNVNGKEHSSSSSSAGMKKINGITGLDVSAEEKNNKVTVHTESWKGAITLTIKVPQGNSTLRLTTVNDGDIMVSNVNGELEIENTNGAIKLTDVSGSVVANTVNGNVTANFKSIDPKAAMAFSTLNGNLDVTFPSTLKANVKLKSDRGEMFTDFDLEADKTQPKVNKTSEKGMYRLNIDDWVYGKINAGGPELMMKNMNGNIYIRKAK